MEWIFDGCGQWESPPSKRNADIPKNAQFVIQVCEDGTFDVSQSTPQLFGNRKLETFNAFSEAVDACEAAEVVNGFELIPEKR